MKRRRVKKILSLPEKANRILAGMLVVLLLIFARVWHVAVQEHEEKVELSKRPQLRTVVERAQRATISDRFGVPMAANQIQYNAAVSYRDIRTVPRVAWVNRVKVFKRKGYITALANLLGDELSMDPERIEDLIHAKAATIGNAPFVLKENISEQEYFRLKMLEREWPGICAEMDVKRVYIQGRVGGEVIGYMGAISQGEYEAISEEMRTLREAVERFEEGGEVCLPRGYTTVNGMRERLKELEGRGYGLSDVVGKSGVEGTYDEQLRGLRGRRRYVADIRGHLLHELEGSEAARSGQKLTLTLSAELQRYAEQLLMEYEQAPLSQRPAALKRQSLIPEGQAWMKGGAIVVMEPKSGEVLALASYPRFDPNDFVRSGDPDENAVKQARIGRWLESEEYLGGVWDLKYPLERERFDPLTGTFYEEKRELGWEAYLDRILPAESPVHLACARSNTLEDALTVQERFTHLLSLFPPLAPSKIIDFVYRHDQTQGVVLTLQEQAALQEVATEEIERAKQALVPFFASLPLNQDKLLFVDLCRLVVDPETFPPFLRESLGPLSLDEYRAASAHFVSVQEGAREIAKTLFHEHHFKKWRAEEFKGYLAQKRKEEAKAKRKYGRPYIEYLDAAEREQFATFWERHAWTCFGLLLGGEDGVPTPDFLPYWEAFVTWRDELEQGAHSALPWVTHFNALEQLIVSFDQSLVLPFLKSLRGFDALTRPLLGRYPGLRRDREGVQRECHLALAFYPTYGYGYARSQAFRQSATVGSLFKLVPAYEAMRQRYVKQAELNPLTIVDDKHRIQNGWNVGFTTDGRPIPHHYKGGRLPRSEHAGVGTVNVVRAIEASSNPYFSLLAGDVCEDPEDVVRAAHLFGFGERTGIDLTGEIRGHLPEDVAYNRTGLYSLAIGQHTLVGTPLQAAVMLAALANGGEILQPKVVLSTGDEETPKTVRWRMFLPESIQRTLLQGLQQVVMGEKGTARSLRFLFPPKTYTRLIGKTSTAEAIERLSLDGSSGSLLSKHIWFGSIAYKDTGLKEPELVVVVYLRHGEWGREAAPLAAKMVEKWHAICSSQ